MLTAFYFVRQCYILAYKSLAKKKKKKKTRFRLISLCAAVESIKSFLLMRNPILPIPKLKL